MNEASANPHPNPNPNPNQVDNKQMRDDLITLLIAG